MRANTLVSELLSQVDVSSGQSDNRVTLRLIQGWLVSRLGCWNDELRKRWGLDELAAMDLSLYPTDESSLDSGEELRQMASTAPTSMEVLAMWVRDILWTGVTVESSVLCPRCAATQLRILETSCSGNVVLSCDLCSWGQDPNGDPWEGGDRLRPIGIARLAEWRNSPKC